MPSLIVGNPVASGPQQLVIGNPYSGQIRPVGSIYLKLAREASGSVYIGLSGGTTLTSGGMFLSGGANSGGLDGVQMGPGDSYTIPRIGTGASGTFTLYIRHDVA